MRSSRVLIALLLLVLAGGAAAVLFLFRHDSTPQPATQSLHDWGKLQSGSTNYLLAEPESANDVVLAVRYAIEHKLAVRVRGRGHSVNGTSLPREGEVLILADGLRHFEKLDNETVVIGAGPTMVGIHQWLGNYGYGLPVYNHGGYGPSLGGFISAGGLGEGSATYGGFWENVEWIGLVDGEGNYRRIERGDPLFPWLFGSMGQLGVIVEAALRIVPERGKKQKKIPAGGTIPDWWKKHPEQKSGYDQIYRTAHVYSISVYAPPGEDEVIRREIETFLKPYEVNFQIRPPLILPIRFINFHPPLLYPAADSFTGISYQFMPKDPALADKALEIEAKFSEFVKERGFRRYIQMELANDPKALREYFGPDLWGEFQAVKRVLDPQGIFGRGLFTDAK